MSGANIIFYLLAAMIIVSAIASVTTRQIFRSAIFLLFSLTGIAGIYFWLDYQFVAAVQIVVYVGGIVVLIIFSIFLTQSSGEKLPQPLERRSLFAGLATLLGLALVLNLLLRYNFIAVKGEITPPLVSNIGEQMLGIDKYGYSLPFEVVSILLLAAMVGCIVIAMRAKTQKS
jgi:NADH-quinone oxidoreductase subunit J